MILLVEEAQRHIARGTDIGKKRLEGIFAINIPGSPRLHLL